MILKLRCPSRAASTICPGQLDLFLDVELAKDRIKAGPANHVHSAAQQGTEKHAEQSTPTSWSDMEIQDLRHGLIRDAIQRLADRRLGRRARAELLEWVTADEITPFSFTVCCLDGGLDPDALRDLLCTQVNGDTARRAA